jgi:hypothetical protein
VALEANGFRATARIRRIVPRDDGRAWYGLDFVSLDPELREMLFDLIGETRPQALDQYWVNAR